MSWSTCEDLLGQRARQRSPGEVDSPGVTTAGVDAPVPGLPTLDDDVYLPEPDAQGSRRGAVRTSLHALALDSALSTGGDTV